jgi:CHAT domain-containing protein
VLPPNSPIRAKEELEQVHQWLRDSAPLVPIVARDALKYVLFSGQAGLLHFACHNSFSDDQDGPRVTFGPEAFTLIDLELIRNMGSLAQAGPLVFLNACRSAGQITLYTQLDGWAQAFIEGGAGAFIGTLWSVRDAAAAQFADVFYSLLAGDGVPFGDAVHQARLEVSKRPRDPSWLAYTAYGHPAATITPTS